MTTHYKSFNMTTNHYVVISVMTGVVCLYIFRVDEPHRPLKLVLVSSSKVITMLIVYIPYLTNISKISFNHLIDKQLLSCDKLLSGYETA